jgi:hypothetical protein
MWPKKVISRTIQRMVRYVEDVGRSSADTMTGLLSKQRGGDGDDTRSVVAVFTVPATVPARLCLCDQGFAEGAPSGHYAGIYFTCPPVPWSFKLAPALL